MIPVERWEIFYADGSTFTSDDGTLAEANPFGVCAFFYYDVTGATLRECGDHEDVILVEGKAEGSDEICFMGLWTDGESYWRVHDLATRTYSPGGDH